MKSQDKNEPTGYQKRPAKAAACWDESDFEYSVQLLRRVPKKCSEAAMAW